MRHLASLLAGAVVAPVGWLLLALGQSQSTETLTGWLQGGQVHSADLLPTAANLGAAALLLGLLATLRISPLGPLVAAVLYLSAYVTVYLSPRTALRFVPETVHLRFVTVPARVPFVNGTLFVLGGALLIAVISVQRWRQWPSKRRLSTANSGDPAQSESSELAGTKLALAERAAAERAAAELAPAERAAAEQAAAEPSASAPLPPEAPAGRPQPLEPPASQRGGTGAAPTPAPVADGPPKLSPPERTPTRPLMPMPVIVPVPRPAHDDTFQFGRSSTGSDDPPELAGVEETAVEPPTSAQEHTVPAPPSQTPARPEPAGQPEPAAQPEPPPTSAPSTEREPEAEPAPPVADSGSRAVLQRDSHDDPTVASPQRRASPHSTSPWAAPPRRPPS